MKKLRNIVLERYGAADSGLENKRAKWDEYEDLYHNRLSDQASQSTKSQVFDPKLSTYLLERSYRVMAQTQTGKVKAISKNDRAASNLMNLVHDKYIIPNANAQFDFLTKCRMVNTYSNLYGNFFTLIDWDVKPNGYVGPDMWLINIRDVFPQVGAVSLDDSEYVIVRSWRNMEYFESLQKRKGFKNVSKIINKLKETGGQKQSRDEKQKSQRESQEYTSSDNPRGKGYYEVLSMYERDRWVDFVVDCEEVLRDDKNPHDDGDFPLVNKYSIPLLDDYMAMGDFERGKTMQYALNSLWNLYLDAVKLSIFPPVLLNKDNIAQMSSIKYSAAAKWLGRGNIGNFANTLNLSPKGIQTFNNTYKLVTSSILNMFGTSDTAVSESIDPGFGKTPQALKMQQARENSRDSADRFYQEQFLSKVSKKFINLMSKNQDKQITVRMFGEEIEEISRKFPEIKDFYDEDSGKLNINKGDTGSILYDYEIVPGSTYAVDQASQQQNLLNLFNSVKEGLAPQQDGTIASPLSTKLAEEGYEVKFGEFFKRILTNSGIQDWDKIVIEQSQDEQEEKILKQTEAQFEQMAQQAMAQQEQQMPNVNEIPPTPMNEQPTMGMQEQSYG